MRTTENIVLSFLRLTMILRLLIGVFLVVARMLVDGEKQNGFSLNFQQNDYKLKPERADVVSYDKDVVKQLTFKTFKYNRTTTSFNCTVQFKVDVSNDVEIVVQAYRFASNEYRLFPLRFQFNFCSAVKAGTFGFTSIGKCGNVTATACPLRKNRIYHICNWTPDESKFPSLIPTGRYMVENQGVYLSRVIFTGRAYAEVYRPLV